jgi:glucosamine 6-phosphate synthetase-like amidotransferase/phosphosugar isomerase protein
MCGIVGVISDYNLSLTERTILRWLSLLDQIRGEHSTGYFFMKADSTSSYIKREGLPHELWQDPAAEPYVTKKGVFKAGDLRILVGHNRFATKGVVNTRNAHPFLVGPIMGVHNGTVLSGLNKLPDHNRFEVDSEAVFNAIGQGWSLDQINKDLNISFALAWIDRSKNTFNIANNGERPLHTVTSKAGATMFFASEAWMLEVALKAVKLTSAYGSIAKMANNEHWVFSTLDKAKIKDVVVHKIEEHNKWESTGFYGRTSYGYPVHHQNHFKGNNSNRRVERKSNDRKPTVLGNHTFDDSLYWTPPKGVTVKEFNLRTSGGCCCCSSPVFFEDFLNDDVKFFGSLDNPVCSFCVLGSEIEGIMTHA